MVNYILVVILLAFFVFGNYSFLDLKEAVVYYGESISETYPSLGCYLFVFIMFFIIFSKEIISYLRVVTNKVKIKQNF